MSTRMNFQVVEKIEKVSDIDLYIPDGVEESVADEICEIIAEELENEVSGIRVDMYDTDDVFAIYEGLTYKNGITYARPIKMFLSRIDKNKYPGYSSDFRFTLCREFCVDCGVMIEE